MRIVKKKSLLVILSLYSFVLFSQEVVFEHFSSFDGLSNNLVRDIIQDSEGYLWFATSGGLNRFDGHYFDIYKPVLGDTSSLSESRLNELFLDSRGYIWARSNLGNVHWIDSKSKKVLNLKEMGIIPHGNIALDIEITSWGDIWISLEEGLLQIFYPEKHDRFEAVYYDETNLLPGNRIHFIHPALDSTVWIGTDRGLVSIRKNNTENPEINRYYNQAETPFISCFESGNELYFGTGVQELLVYNQKSKIFTRADQLNQFLNGNIQAISANAQELILFGTDVGDIALLDKKTGQYTYFRTGHYQGLDATFIDQLFADKYGVFWLIPGKRGIYQFDPVTRKFKYFGLNFENRTFLGEPDKQIIFEDSNNDLWIGINGGGLFLFNREGNYFHQFNHDPNNYSSISSDIILSIYEDKSKNLWIGTSYGGINKVSLREDQFKQIAPVESPKTGFDNYIRSVVTDPLGNIYVGSKAGKIFVYSGEQKIGTIPDDLYDPSQFPATNIYCMYFDNDHNLWVGTKGNGIFVFKSLLGYFTNLKHKDIVIEHITQIPGSNNTLSTDNVYSIIQDFHGQYWIGSFSGGLDMLTDPFNDPVFRNFSANADETGSIVSDEVRYLLLDNNHNLWIATSEGISILESKYLRTENKSFINIHPSLQDTSNLSGKVVYQIMQSRNNDIFVAMLDGGLNQLKATDFENRKFNWIHHTSELLSPNVYSIEEDNSGNIWMGTDNGLFRLRPEDGNTEKYRIKSSYLPLAFSESTSGKTSRYEMVFGSKDGFILFHPDSIHKDSTQFPLNFSRLEVNGEHIHNANSDILKMSIEKQRGIELSHTQNNVTLYFSVLDFHKPDAIQYSYFLDGYDSYWSTPSSANYANYRKLAPGDYTLYVRGTNSSGIRMNDVASLEIRINPPFWKTPRGHFLIAVFILLISGIAIFIIYRQIFIQNKIKVENAITEKRIEYYTNISHEFKTPLSLILNPVEEIITSHKSSDFAKQKGLQIKKNATHLKRLIEQILDFRKLREGKMQLKVAQVNLINFFREIYLIFLPLANKMNIKLQFETTQDEYLGYADITQLEKVAFNLLSNALRFTPTGKTVLFAVNIIEEEKRLEFRVEDRGPGIDEEDLPRIFDRFYMSKGSTGIGLFFTRELVYLHKGNIQVNNRPGGGAAFRISIPVDVSAYYAEEIDTTRLGDSTFDLNPIDDIEAIISDNEATLAEHNHSVAYMEKILIVEDSEEMRKYLAAELSKKYKVYKALDGEEGLMMLKQYMPDLVLSDIKMPKLDGFEFTKKIRENYFTSHIPVILLSAEASEENKIKGISVGADDYVVKPFNMNYLLTKIEKTIAQRKILISRIDQGVAKTQESLTNGEKSSADFITEVQNLITSNLSNQKLNVEFLVEKMGISRTLFFKKIKTSSGFSPNEYIRKERMKEASRLLTSTEMTINEIGFAVGFSDSNYFGKSFKKHFGMTPSEYKHSHGRKPLI